LEFEEGREGVVCMLDGRDAMLCTGRAMKLQVSLKNTGLNKSKRNQK